MTLPQLPQDKASHLIAGLVCFCLFGLISPETGLMSAVVVGALKEIYDHVTGQGQVELLDFAATAFGGGVGFYCSLI